MQRQSEHLPEKPPVEAQGQARLHVPRLQLLGVAFIAALPVLALLGAFGPSRSEAGASDGPLGLSVTYPARLPLGEQGMLDIRIRNTANRALDDVAVHIDPQYLAGCAELTVTPVPFSANAVGLKLAPGQTFVIAVQFRADAPGSLRGKIRVTSGAGHAEVECRTLVFP